MDITFTLLKRSFRRLGMLCLVVLIISPISLTASRNLNQEISLLEAIELLSQKYNVYFTYDRTIVSDVMVHYKKEKRSNVKDELHDLLKETDLNFQIFESQFVIIYKKDEQGLRSLRQMKIMMEGILEEEDGKKEVHQLVQEKRKPAPVLLPRVENSLAQRRVVLNVSGTVIDVQGVPLIGVNVQVKGTGKGTATDFDGKFTIEDVGEQAVLVLSYIGYQSQEVPVNGRTELTIIMQEDIQTLDEVVVIGYGTQKKSDLTGAVEKVDVEQFKNQAINQLTDVLAGTVAGFSATQSSSAAGGSSMEIRGPNSLNASTEPMIVLDGAIYNGSIRDINPTDVESIDILKDASSAAIFGARAASGVILITTTKGKKGKPTINLSVNLGVSEPTDDSYAVRSPQGYLDYRRDLFRGDPNFVAPDYRWHNPQDLPQGVTIEQWRAAANNPNPDDTLEWLSRLNFYPGEVENYLAGKTTDWSKEVLQRKSRHETTLSVSGGTDNSSYYWSIGYLDNQGIVKGDMFSTIRSRLNVEFDIVDWLKVGANIQYANRDESTVTASLVSMNNVTPYGNVYDENGNIEWYPGGSQNATNPLINTLGQDRQYKHSNLFSTLFADITLPLGITYRFSYQPSITSYRDYNYWSPETITGGRTYADGRSSRDDHSGFDWLIDNILKWNKRFGEQNFDVTLLYSSEKSQGWLTTVTNQTFKPSPLLGYSGLQFGSNPSVNTNDNYVTGDALMARLNYSFRDRYLLTASVRRDGYSAFGQMNPRATFPSLALAWIISHEDFFNVDMISFLKLRASWGRNGNRSIGAYSALARMSSNQYYDGNNVQQGIFTSSLSNSGLRWEETESINLGLNVGFLENRINLSLDYYDMITENLLVNRTLPILTGFRNITTNIGELANKGFEVTLSSVNVSARNLYWKSNFNFSLNRNKLNKLFGDMGTYILEGKTFEGELPDYTNNWFPGYAIDVIWDYDIEGMWQVEEKDEAAKYSLYPGDIKAVDRDNNNVYEAIFDKTFIGYTEPRFRLGLRNDFTLWNNFELSFFLRSDLGHQRSFPAATAEGSTMDRRSTANYPYWSPDNRSNEWPRLYTRTASFGGGVTVYKPASFLRLQDISVSYNLTRSVSRFVSISNARVFGAVRNLVSVDNWPGWDPETGHSPLPRVYSVGLNISF